MLPLLQLLRAAVQGLFPLGQPRLHPVQLRPPLAVLPLRLLTDPVRFVLRLDDRLALAGLDLLLGFLTEPRDLVALGPRSRLEALSLIQQHGPGSEGENPHHAQGKITKPLHQMRTFLHVRLNP